MAGINDLSFELILRIISYHKRSLCMYKIYDLSLVSRAFNDACSVFRFREHCVCLREENKPFDLNYARERIAVISRKHSFIRELEIKDEKSNDVDALPDEIMPDLISALQLIDSLEVLKLCNSSSLDEERCVPDLLWGWIRDKADRITEVHILGPLLPPAQADAIESIPKMSIEPLTMGNGRFIKVVKAPDLYIANPNLIPLKPGKEEEHIRDVYVFASSIWDEFLKMDEKEQVNRLDFSELTSSATILVHISSANEWVYRNKFEEWDKVRKVANKIFAESLTTFNVQRRFQGEPHMLVCRTPDMKVWCQHQVVDEEADAAEFNREEERVSELFQWHRRCSAHTDRFHNFRDSLLSD